MKRRVPAAVVLGFAALSVGAATAQESLGEERLLATLPVSHRDSTGAEVLVIHPLLGDTIDAQEAETYGLFASIRNFVTAQYVRMPDGKLAVRVVSYDESGMEDSRVQPVVGAGLLGVRNRIQEQLNEALEARRREHEKQTAPEEPPRREPEATVMPPITRASVRAPTGDEALEPATPSRAPLESDRPGRAESGRKITVCVSTGLSMPLAPTEFADFWRSGVNVGGGLDYALTDRRHLQFYTDYSRFSLNKDEIWRSAGSSRAEAERTGVSVEGGTAWMLSLSARLRSILTTRDAALFEPYAVGGVGLVYTETGSILVSGPQGSFEFPTASGGTDFAVELGVGSDMRVSDGVTLFAEVKYSIAYDEDETRSGSGRAGLRW